jgi:hypothetical protein
MCSISFYSGIREETRRRFTSGVNNSVGGDPTTICLKLSIHKRSSSLHEYLKQSLREITHSTTGSSTKEEDTVFDCTVFGHNTEQIDIN